ncbi:hypothetical protein [uncultured Desulfobacter sp.]|uniref:hypothetical protein n=1 Tax=uncultured Desulfobacter sp. TaxID=240139 RepID=UPI002AAA69DD|nr:hypothetical protein [uncultured Desulfobacter sp.]
MDRGWFKIYRRLAESDFWVSEPFSKPQAWVDLIALANHKPGTVWIRGVEISVNRGQTARSELTLSKRWKWSRKKVRNFLKWLEKEQQIEQQKSNVTSLISIINYDQYQTDGTAERTAEGTTEEHQKNTKGYTNKNDKNNKNEKNIIISPLTPQGGTVSKKKEFEKYLIGKIQGTSFVQYQKKLIEFVEYRMSFPAVKRYKTTKGIDGLLTSVGDLIRAGLDPIECLDKTMEEEWLKPKPEYFSKGQQNSGRAVGRSEQNKQACASFIERMMGRSDYEE